MLKFGKTEIAKVVDILEQGDYSSAEEAAVACLKVMEAIFASRAKFVVVGQLKSTLEDGELPPLDERAIIASLGWFSTEGDAKTASESLWRSHSTGETFRTVIAPVYHGTAADFHKVRKGLQDKRKAAMEKRRRERLREYIDKADGKSMYDPEHPGYTPTWHRKEHSE